MNDTENMELNDNNNQDNGADNKPLDNKPQQSPASKESLDPLSIDDSGLENEINEALGDMSILDIYGMNEEADSEIGDQGVAGAKSTPGGTERKQPESGQYESRRKPTVVSEAAETSAPGVNRGKVISVTKDGVFIDLGGKSQGFLPSEELEENEQIDVNSEIDVVILRYDARDGLLILSRKSAEQQLLRKNLKEGALVEARVTGSNKGGLELDIKGLKAFMPASQIDIIRIEDFEPLVGQSFVCEVVQVERGDKNIILSRRMVLEREQLERRENLWETLQVGDLCHGLVRSLMDYGAFVDLGGLDGLLHVSELSWSRVKHPQDVLQVGQGIDVVVIGKDEEKRRLALSLRQAGGDPWTVVEQKYTVGTRHQAQITRLMDFGAFAELEPGVEGLIPISEMTWTGRVRKTSDVVKAGMMVEIEVLKLDVDKRRISLSMKNLQDNPWLGVAEKYQKDNIYPGKVARVTEFGAFVTLEAGVDGLLHISEISEKHINKASEVLRHGQEVQVRILNVDPDNCRIALSMKHIESAGTIEEESPQPAAEKKKKERPLRGGLTW